jgi:histidinol-phosphate aminotransferase
MTGLASSPSRRTFARWLGAGAAVAVLRPAVSFGGAAPAPATSSTPPAAAPHAPGRRVVQLSANENPYGPPPAALEALRAAIGEGNRYPDARAETLIATLAAHHQVGAESIVLGCGSSQILHAAAAAFCGGANGLLVTADPTFEALGRYATVRGAEVKRLALTADYRHPLAAMHDALVRPGLAYVCNPNNPTASLTPAAELRGFLDALPQDRVALVDEAYHHYADGAAEYASVAHLAAERSNLVVARTFSKVYGMAGLRCGYAIAHPTTAAKMREQIPFDPSNALALAAANAALGERAHVEQARKTNAEVRAWAMSEVERAGAKSIPSAANFFMAELGRDVAPIIAALRAEGVEIGRRFPALPTHLRITVGTADEMHVFADAFHRVWHAAAA